VRIQRAILLAQCLDHGISLVGAAAFLNLGLRAAGLDPIRFVGQGGALLATSFIASLFVASVFYRAICLGLQGRSFGCTTAGLATRDGTDTLTLLKGHVWEALGLAFPLFWFIEHLMRLAGHDIGLPYVFWYKRSEA
jgi:hypothetical protein